MKFFQGSAILFLATIFAGCSPAGLIKPLEKGRHALSAHAGGPGIHFAGMPIPVPLSGMEYHYGLKDNLSFSAGAGITSLAFGTAQLHAGVLAAILEEKEKNLTPGLSGFIRGHFLLDRWEKQFRFYPEAGFHLFTRLGKHRWYTGGSAWFETRFPSSQRTSANVWIPMVHAGWQKASGRWQPSAELKWIAPNLSSENLVVDYIGISGKGTLGIYVGLLRNF